MRNLVRRSGTDPEVKQKSIELISMRNFSILLIENQISVTADIVPVISQHLTHYSLTIARDITEAINESDLAQVILLNVSHLSTDISGRLSLLAEAYSDVPIVLLVPPPTDLATEEDIVLEALAAGASDYVYLSKAGLLTLGRRLASLQSTRSESLEPSSFSFSKLLCQAIADDTSQLAMQLIGADNHVRAWNKAAESFFGLKREQVVGRLIDELPLSANNLSRLKDILDQVRATGQPFFIPLYPLEGQQQDSRWVHAQVYPIRNELSTDKDELLTDIYIISSPASGPREGGSEDWRQDQELQILLEASHEIAGQLELIPTLEKAIEKTRYLLYANNCQIYLLEKDNQTLRPALAIGPSSDQIQARPLTVGQGAIGQTAATGKPAVLNSTDIESEIPDFEDKYLLCAPLTALKGTIGLMVASRASTSFSQDDLRFFESLVQQASSAINNARLFEETQRSLSELAILYDASTVISTNWNDQDVLNTLIEKMVEAIGTNKGLIVNWNKNQNTGVIQAEFSKNQAGSQQGEALLGKTFNLTERPALLAVVNQQRPVFFNLSNPALDETERKAMEKHGCFSRLLVPLITKGEAIGWTELWDTQRPRVFTANEVRMSRALSSHIAVALENAQYLKQTQQTLEETTALYRVASALANTQDPQTIISAVLQEYLHALSLKQGSVVIFDFNAKLGIVRAHHRDDNPVRPAVDVNHTGKVSTRVMEGQEIPLQNNPVYELMMRTHQPVIIDDPKAKWLTEPPIFARSLHIPPVGGWGDEDAFAVLVVPIKIWGEIVGAIVVENTRHERPFDRGEISLGQAVADQLGIGLQNVQLYESEYQRREQAETLREVASTVSSSLNLNEVLERILDQLRRVIDYDSAAIQLIEGNQRRVIAGRGFSDPEEHIGLTYPINIDPTEPGSIAIHNRRPLVHGNISEIYGSFKQAKHSHIKSWIGIPLIARDKVIGLISIDNSEINAYTEEDVQLAVAFANQVAIALENARLYEIEVRELERELIIAHQIQETLLPQSIPQVPGLDIAGRTVPARQVGGDFFHFVSIAPDQLGVAIGDVSGKGIPAALYMAACITAIDTQIGPDITPGELLNELSRALYNRLRENKMNVALQVATFIPLPAAGDNNDEEGKPKKARGSLMTVASAGMIAPIGATKYGCRILPVGSLPVGALPASEYAYTDDVFLLDPFTTIIFTSDGIVEAQNKTGELFGFERLEVTILEVVATHNATTIADHIINAAQEFIGETEQNDDMTVVVVVKA